jgi:hypothetical protein
MGCSCTRDQDLIINKRTPLKIVQKDNMNSSINNYIYSTMIHSAKVNPNTNNISLSKIDKQEDTFIIILSFKNSNKYQINYQVIDNEEYMKLADLLNKALFNSVEYDTNFISEYNEKEDIFEYKIERLRIKSKKKQSSISYNTIDYTTNYSWSIFINATKENLSSLINMGRVIYKDDIIELREE